jgi:hypothetical protein
MGVFYYSKPRNSVTASEVEAPLRDIAAKLWSNKYRVEQTPGVPTTHDDPRVAKWEFWPEGWTEDCAFTVSLLADGRLEFKVPRSQFDEWYRDQCKVRRALVRRLNS